MAKKAAKKGAPQSVKKTAKKGTTKAAKKSGKKAPKQAAKKSVKKKAAKKVAQRGAPKKAAKSAKKSSSPAARTTARSTAPKASRTATKPAPVKKAAKKSNPRSTARSANSTPAAAMLFAADAPQAALSTSLTIDSVISEECNVEVAGAGSEEQAVVRVIIYQTNTGSPADTKDVAVSGGQWLAILTLPSGASGTWKVRACYRDEPAICGEETFTANCP